MKEAIILTKEEYLDLQSRLQEADDIITAINVDLSWAFDRINALWNALNRPAIEAAAKAHDEEFYSWCDEMAEKYDELDWIERMDKKYNHPKSSWKKYAEQYKSPDNLEKSHGWIMKDGVCNNNFWIMRKNAQEYSGPTHRWHDHMLFCLMNYFACYGNKKQEDFWKHLLKVLHNMDL